MTEGEPEPSNRDLSSYPAPSPTAARQTPLRRRLRRALWIGAAGVLIVAAFIGIAAVLRGKLTETDWKILATLGALLLAGTTAVAGLSLVEQRKLPGLGWVAVGSAALGFAFVVASIWDEFGNDDLARLAGSAAVVLVGMLLATTGRILLRTPRLLVLYGAMVAALVLALLVTVGAIWSDDAGDGTGKAIATFWILAALGWFLVPVVQRFVSTSAEETSVRVLAALDGVELLATRGAVEGVAVDPLAPGERLVLRRRETPT